MTQLSSEFTNQYAISKSLRFELKPIEQTGENIKKDNVLIKDKEKAEAYKEVKKIIDDFHRDFIERGLSGIGDMDWSPLKEAIDNVKKATKKTKDTELQSRLEKAQAACRKEIVACIKQSTPDEDKFKDITNADLIKKILPKWLDDQKRSKEIALLEEFKGFDGYFTGLHETRKNIYSDKAQTTALAYRIVHDNFEKFLTNLEIYQQHFDKIKNHKIWPGLDENIDKLGDEVKGKNTQQLIKYIECFFNQGLNKSFNKCLNQSGISDFNDNIVASINLLFNSYRQQKKLKAKDLPFMKELFKQILAKSDKGQWIEKLANDGDVISVIDDYRNNLKENDLKEKETLESLGDIFKKLNNDEDEGEYNLSQIYWQTDQLGNLSSALFGDWRSISSALTNKYEQDNQNINDKDKDKDNKKCDKWLKQNFSIKCLQEAINNYIDIADMDFDKNKNYSIVKYLSEQGKLLKIDDDDYQAINQKYKDSEDKKLTKDAEKDVEIIKTLLDTYNEILWLFKPLMPKKKKGEDKNNTDIVNKDEAFYSDLEKPYHRLSDITHLYNLVRNYITQKPYSTEKYKLNFYNPTLADGWDINKEKDNTSVILEKGGLYYLAIMHKQHRKTFQDAPTITKKEDCYQKLNYKLLSGANKMLPKVFFSKKGLKNFSPPKKILDLYKNEEHKKGDTFSLKNCHQLIDFFKSNISKYKAEPEHEYGWEVFGFNFSPTSSYEDISQFYKEVEQQGYKIWFSAISKTYIDECIRDGKLYLFQLYNKDFSPHSKGKPNLHTLYWKALFSPENIKNTIYKLNGEAELFYRPSSITYKQSIWDKGHHANDPKKKQNYPIIKDRRFAQNKYFFHVPITINFKAKDGFDFNQKVRDFLRGNKDVNVIGIDRGEKNLAYYSVIDQQGKIIDQATFNTINDFDYWALLNKLEGERQEARKNWKKISRIKDVKAGYISQVVHKISQLMVEHNAIVVMEDLNMGMKRGRQKIEKQVYQNLEKALISKLNYLSFKEYKMDENGSIRHGLQLAAPFESFAKMSKQTGFIFYVSAPYTSKIDFQTGFAPFKYFKHETLEKSEELMQGIISIRHVVNDIANDFIIDIDYSKVAKSRASPKTKWQLHLDNKERYEWNNKKSDNQKSDNQKVNVYDELTQCFSQNEINLEGNIKEHIIKKNKAEVYKILFKYINLVSQMRFTSSESKEDYILSPVQDDTGKHFRTDLDSKTTPKDSDANGAYHIALKGVYLLKKRINEENKNLFISNEEWFTYAQDMAKKR